jgi:hypothetical protein
MRTAKKYSEYRTDDDFRLKVDRAAQLWTVGVSDPSRAVAQVMGGSWGQRGECMSTCVRACVGEVGNDSELHGTWCCTRSQLSSGSRGR